MHLLHNSYIYKSKQLHLEKQNLSFMLKLVAVRNRKTRVHIISFRKYTCNYKNNDTEGKDCFSENVTLQDENIHGL